MTRKTPRRRMTLHLLQMRFTEALTFILNSALRLSQPFEIIPLLELSKVHKECKP